MSISNPTTDSIDDVIITSQLESRQSKTPDYAGENRVLANLASLVADAPQEVFQKLVDGARELCMAGSAGISILNEGVEPSELCWQATSGKYASHTLQTLPLGLSPCGTVLDRKTVILMSDPVRFFPYVAGLNSPVSEVLLVPVYDGPNPVGTVWVVMHDDSKKFDSEDVRVVTNLTKFASAALRNLHVLQSTEQVERELREIRARIESTLIAGEIGTWIYDIRADRVRADKNLAQQFGISENDAAGAPLELYLTVVHPDDRERVAELIRNSVSSHASFEAEYRLSSRDRGIRWVVARGIVERDADGIAVALPGVLVDITDQKRVEAELRASEDRRQLALDAAELGTWNLDAATDVLTCDERFIHIFSGSSANLSFEQAFALIHPDDRKKVRDGIAAAVAIDDPVPYESEYRVTWTDDSTHWIFAKGRANFSGEGKDRRVVSLDGTVVGHYQT